ncbi:MAG: hypothetical protein JWL77_783 [Chthonomonadaceae bacterium]|nr:hypothetical protein [Chthonomonadaceae bacterium]
MKDNKYDLPEQSDRRSFLKKGLAGAGAATLGAGLWAEGRPAAGQGFTSGHLTQGDVAILRFLAAVELIESDLWLQYAELGGTQDNELPGLTGGCAAYTAALSNLDGDMAQYIHDNTEDEFTHAAFLNAYLVSKGQKPVNFDMFRNLPSSKATGAQQIGRLTNLMQLTVDTSWWTRYRSRSNNPDLDPDVRFPQAVPSLSNGRFPAIPRSNADLTSDIHIQAIANTAAFHFCFIEQGGSSLYPTLALKVTNLEVLQILLSIGPVETTHFQTWHDKAGNAVPLTDPTNPNLVFPDLNAPPFGGEDFQTNLIMPEPVPFLSRKLPKCSIIRPTSTEFGGAVATIASFIKDGLFLGQPREFLALLFEMAEEADEARRAF